MSKYPYMPLFIDAYRSDTQHLSYEAHGIYLTLLMLIWKSPECRIPNDKRWLCTHLRILPEDYEFLINPIIKQFLKSTGNWLTQKRLKREFLHTQKISKNNSDAAKSRWAKEKSVSKRNAPKPKPKEEVLLDIVSNNTVVISDETEAFRLWNELAEKHGLPKAQRFSKTRQSRLRARLKDCAGLNGWEAALEKIANSPFLLGDNPNGWKATLDFVLRDSSFTKLMEGNYEQSDSSTPNSARNRSSGDKFDAAIRKAVDKSETEF